MAQKRASCVAPRRRLLHKQPEPAAFDDRQRDRHRVRTRKRSSGKYEKGTRRGTWNQVEAEYVRDQRALEDRILRLEDSILRLEAKVSKYKGLANLWRDEALKFAGKEAESSEYMPSPSSPNRPEPVACRLEAEVSKYKGLANLWRDEALKFARKEAEGSEYVPSPSSPNSPEPVA
jgi:hypothetical protein